MESVSPFQGLVGAVMRTQGGAPPAVGGLRSALGWHAVAPSGRRELASYTAPAEDGRLSLRESTVFRGAKDDDDVTKPTGGSINLFTDYFRPEGPKQISPGLSEVRAQRTKRRPGYQGIHGTEALKGRNKLGEQIETWTHPKSANGRGATPACGRRRNRSRAGVWLIFRREDRAPSSDAAAELCA